jgi:hypothetical protein
MEERKRRNAILREAGARKNREFRRRFVGRTLSAVTIGDGSAALSGNYIRIELSWRREPNRLVEVPVAQLTPRGVAERNALAVLG